MLVFPLKKEWFEKIKRGEKKVEYREVKPYWTKRLAHEGILLSKKVPYVYKKIQANAGGMVFPPECIFRLGYTKETLHTFIERVEIVDGWDTDLHIFADVYAIHFANVRETQ